MKRGIAFKTPWWACESFDVRIDDKKTIKATNHNSYVGNRIRPLLEDASEWSVKSVDKHIRIGDFIIHNGCTYEIIGWDESEKLFDDDDVDSFLNALMALSTPIIMTWFIRSIVSVALLVFTIVAIAVGGLVCTFRKWSPRAHRRSHNKRAMVRRLSDDEMSSLNRSIIGSMSCGPVVRFMIDGKPWSSVLKSHRRRDAAKHKSGVIPINKNNEVNSDDESDNKHGVMRTRHVGHDVPDSHGIRGMIDGYLNDLARVGVNSNTGDSMDIIADYWGEVENLAHDDVELMSYSADLLEPVKALGDVVGLYTGMLRARHGFYSGQAIDDARRCLDKSENDVIALLRRTGERMNSRQKASADSSMDYLEMRRMESR